ncbi:MAG: hypothetical protein ACE5FL_02215 [Myxococcota bacterium]
MTGTRRTLAFAVAVVFGLLISAEAFAQPRAETYGQFLSRKASDGGRTKIQNPTAWEMFSVLISYDGNGNFDACDSEVIPSKGTTSNSVNNDNYIEVLSVATEGKERGRISHRVGVFAIDHKANMSVHNASMYQLPTDSTVRQNVIDCICQELASAGLSKRLMRSFGINCP